MTNLTDRIEHARKVQLALANELLVATHAISRLRRDIAECRVKAIEECAVIADAYDYNIADTIRALIGAAPRGRAAPRPGRAEDSPSSRPGLTPSPSPARRAVTAAPSHSAGTGLPLTRSECGND